MIHGFRRCSTTWHVRINRLPMPTFGPVGMRWRETWFHMLEPKASHLSCARRTQNCWPKLMIEAGRCRWNNAISERSAELTQARALDLPDAILTTGQRGRQPHPPRRGAQRVDVLARWLVPCVADRARLRNEPSARDQATSYRRVRKFWHPLPSTPDSKSPRY